MTSKERFLNVIKGKSIDHIPLTTWCFGFKPHPSFVWEKNGVPLPYWYSMRMEHIHKIPHPWTFDDEFKRVLAWLSIGIDDTIDISIPWSVHPEVSWKDSVREAQGALRESILIREYKTPGGALRHAVKRTHEEIGEGWVIQPDFVSLFEDYNIPRGVKHIVTGPEDIIPVRYLYLKPDKTKIEELNKRIIQIEQFVNQNEVVVQAWPAFGMDAVVWLMGVENAVYMAMDQPEDLKKLVEILFKTDYERTSLACSYKIVDVIVERGWYSSIDFWSPKLFDQFVFPYMKQLIELVHSSGKYFGYVMTTGVEKLGKKLMDAGVDILYFVDPVQDRLDPVKAREIFDSTITLVGGINTVLLTEGNKRQIEETVRRSIEYLAPTGKFILHPVDALFPDTPWESMEFLIEIWKKYR